MANPLDRLKTALADRYAVEREIGSGGMATVYVGEDLKHHRRVAIKVLNPDLAASVGPDRFLREIETAANLVHPHILPLFDSGQADGLVFYVMPYVEGESLRERLEREQRLPVDDAIRIAREIADALAYAHDRGIVHRDVKPANILLEAGHAVLADFGVAQAVVDETRLTAMGVSLGTPSYMSPEQASGERDLDGRSDQYSLGCVLYEMLVGEPPFTGKGAASLVRQHLLAGPSPIRQSRASVPDSVSDAVTRALSKTPADRFGSAASLAQALSQPLPPTKVKAMASNWVLATVVLVAVLVGGYSVLARGRAETMLTRAEVAAELERYSQAVFYDSAWALARQAERDFAGDSVFESLRSRYSRSMSVLSEPEGATVHRRWYGDAKGEWELLGTTPIEEIHFPLGTSRLRFEKDGFQTLELGNVSGRIAGVRYRLAEEGGEFEDMVWVSGGDFQIRSPGLEGLEPIPLGSYWIDRDEVTNAEFKRFVDAGGYGDPAYWSEPFELEGREVPWDEATAHFTDRTGRTGPSTWIGGDYAEGADRHPVTGISWYEAAAYARFMGKQLPTIYHWNRAAETRLASSIVPMSNLNRSALADAGEYSAVSGWGARDMAGNVREWCLNESGQNRYILGGGWNDEIYMFVDAYTQPAWDRSETNGMRLARYEDGEDLTLAARPIVRPIRDFRAEEPIGDETFEAYLAMYAYDKTPLNAELETRATDSSDWVREQVTFDAAYGGERMQAILYTPTRVSPPYQTVLFFPGSGALFNSSTESHSLGRYDFLPENGRAVLVPVFKGTYDRGGGSTLETDFANETVAWRDIVIQWARDLGRSIDYIETRDDLDAERLAYFGVSWGGEMGGIMLAVEPRFDAGILYVAGLSLQRSLPEVDPVNYVRRITTPVLMLSGRYDHFFPYATSQLPMFELLGTRPEDKAHKVYGGGHSVPTTDLIRETLDWLDRYLGPVN